MNKYVDKMDIILHEQISNIKNPKLTDIDISNIIKKAEKIRRRKILRNVAVFFAFALVSMSVIIVRKNILNNNYVIDNKFADIDNNIVINNSNDEKPIAELYENNNNGSNVSENGNIKTEEIKTVIYTLKGDNSAFNSTSSGCFETNPNEVYVSMENVSKMYVLEVEQIVEYSFATQKPITKLECKILDTVKGEECENIQISLDGGIVSIFELENSNLEYSLDEEYKNLSDTEKKNTFVRLVSSISYNKLAEPKAGKCYIVSLNENNEVIENCDYPFLEFDFNNKLYKKDNVWNEFNF